DGEEFSSGTVYIDDERTEEIVRESLVSEVVRAIQQERKEAGLEVEQKVELYLDGDTEALKEHEEEIRERVNVSGIIYEEPRSEKGSVEFQQKKVAFGFESPS
ncbi:MAG: DUF5915 domain-containing protein, partial [Candidatus Nanohaloarchaea archaeon]